MQVTRRFTALVAAGLLFVVTAVLFRRPVLLLGAAGLGAWLLTRQYLFIRALAQIDEAIAVDLSLTPQQVATEESTEATLVATLSVDASLPITITATPPVATEGATKAERTLRIPAGNREARATFTLQSPVAGAHTFEQATVRVTDATDLFTETLFRGPTPTLIVEPRAPRNVHVGEGGEQVLVAYGEHESERLGSGLDPVEIREYQPGDPAHRIDWNATARLNHPYIREYEAESDRRTALVLDHRATLAHGQPGERKLDYLREVALGFLNSAQELSDPIGLYTVADDGITGSWNPTALAEQYERLRIELRSLQPTDSTNTGVSQPSQPSAAARTAAIRLDTDTSPFATTLQPYFESPDAYVARVADDPLFSTIDTVVSRLQGPTWTTIFTDDTNRTELREAVKLARSGENHVLVFITPDVLFDPDALADLEAAYDRYVDFEDFRRDLAKLDRVVAFEVGPGDRLSELLESQYGRRVQYQT